MIETAYHIILIEKPAKALSDVTSETFSIMVWAANILSKGSLWSWALLSPYPQLIFRQGIEKPVIEGALDQTWPSRSGFFFFIRNNPGDRLSRFGQVGLTPETFHGCSPWEKSFLCRLQKANPPLEKGGLELNIFSNVYSNDEDFYSFSPGLLISAHRSSDAWPAVFPGQ
jgi:hypothetical protein